jgi:hypothetical protein
MRLLSPHSHQSMHLENGEGMPYGTAAGGAARHVRIMAGASWYSTCACCDCTFHGACAESCFGVCCCRFLAPGLKAEAGSTVASSTKWNYTIYTAVSAAAAASVSAPCKALPASIGFVSHSCKRFLQASALSKLPASTSCKHPLCQHCLNAALPYQALVACNSFALPRQVPHIYTQYQAGYAMCLLARQ